MATIKTGQVGVFKGKIGHIVVSGWRGVTVGKSAPGKKTKPATAGQRDQQKKFGTVSRFLRLFDKQIAIGWASGKRTVTPINEAVSYHLGHALTGVYPDYVVDYTKAVPSRGKGVIDGGFRPVATPASGHSVDVSWVTSNSTSAITQPTDLATVIFYNEDRGRACIAVGTAQRDALKTNIVMPQPFDNCLLHVYLMFISQDGKLASRSEYLGELKV